MPLTVAVSSAGLSVPPDGVPDTFAILVTSPASKSACVTLYVAAHVVEVPGANVVTGQDTDAILSSDTDTSLIVTLPIFSTS